MSSDLLAPQPIAVRKPNEIEPLAVGLRDAARLLGVHYRHLQNLALAGKVPSAMIGRRRVFRVRALELFLIEQEQREGAGSEST
jgi:excisionase family DNA binding protein